MEKDFNLKKYIQKKYPYLEKAKKIKEITYGGIDGTITTFVVIAGFSGASFVSENSSMIGVSILLLFAFASLIADGFSMGVSDFLSSRSELKFYQKEKKKELKNIEKNLEDEEKITMEILQNQGFEKKDAEKILALYKKNKNYWSDFMMKFKLDLESPEEHPIFGAIATFFSFIFFGFIPLIPYLFLDKNQFLYSCIFGIFALSILGFLRAKLSFEKTFFSILEIVFLGSFAASIAYIVGLFFNI